jgi:hypothetical protein
MKRLTYEAEEYVKSNPEDPPHQAVKFKFDMEENRTIEQKQAKKKG